MHIHSGFYDSAYPDLQVWVAKARERQMRKKGRKGVHPLDERISLASTQHYTTLYTILYSSRSTDPRLTLLRHLLSVLPLPPHPTPQKLLQYNPPWTPTERDTPNSPSHTQQPESSPNHTVTLHHPITKILYRPTSEHNLTPGHPSEFEESLRYGVSQIPLRPRSGESGDSRSGMKREMEMEAYTVVSNHLSSSLSQISVSGRGEKY
jgi:hypothetical protein